MAPSDCSSICDVVAMGAGQKPVMVEGHRILRHVGRLRELTGTSDKHDPLKDYLACCQSRWLRGCPLSACPAARAPCAPHIYR